MRDMCVWGRDLRTSSLGGKAFLEGSGSGCALSRVTLGCFFPFLFLFFPRYKYSEHKLQTLSYFSPKKGFNYM